MAFIGNGAQLTDLDAGDIASGTLPLARGGTGTTNTVNTVVAGSGISVSTSGTQVTVSSSGGGVTSLNGQTGAITNTSLYAIGGYITGRPLNRDNYGVNSTIAGSSLYSTQINAYVTSTKSGAVFQNTLTGNTIGNFNLINTGTWRCVSSAWGNNGVASLGLWVRIS